MSILDDIAAAFAERRRRKGRQPGPTNPPPTPNISPTATVAIVCKGCDSGVLVLASETSYHCSVCGGHFLLRRCPGCSRPVYAPVLQISKVNVCTACGQECLWSSWDKLPVTAAQMAEVASIPLEKAADPSRRVIRGRVISSTGFHSVIAGNPCKIEFTSENISVLMNTGQGYQSIETIAYSESPSLRIDGPGAITSTSGGGMIGGGFGIKGAVKGILLASAFNALTTRERTTIETIVELTTDTQGMLVLNEEITPELLRIRLTPVFALLKANTRRVELPTAKEGDPISSIEGLAALRDKGLLTNEEFEKGKRAILDSIGKNSN